MALPAGAANKTIVFFGDSLTAGYGLSEDSAYPALIQKYMKADGLDWQVVNAGISGDTTSGGLKRLNWVMKSGPDAVLVALGSNDGLRGLDLNLTEKNLESIITQIKRAHIRVLLAGMMLPVNYGPAYRKKFAGLFARIAAKEKVPLYPFLLEGIAMKPEYTLPDGVHPNRAGQEILARRVYQFIKPYLAGGKDPVIHGR